MHRAIVVLLAVLLVVTAAQAQITINSTQVPHAPGTRFQFYSLPAADSLLVNVGPTGGPQVWDFTQGDTSTITTDLYLNPAQSPPQYGRANVVVQTDQLNLFGLAGQGILYYWLGTPRYILGAVSSNYQGTPIDILFSPYVTQFPLPLSMGRTWSNQVNIDQTFNVGGNNYRIVVHSTLNSSVDAWGTAMVPLGNYRVLRTRTNVTYDLTVYIQVFGIWVPVSQQSGTSVNYDWRTQINGSVLSLTTASSSPGRVWATGIRRLMNNSSEFAAIEPEITPTSPTAATFQLHANYPNPFNSQTTLSYELRAASSVKLTVYDALGREVATLLDGRQEAGTHEIAWTPQNLAAGAYFVQLRAGNQAAQQMVLYLK